jgi:hypothetical protein
VLGRRVSERLAARLTRRSLVTRLGESAIAVSLGSAGLAYLAGDAAAHTTGGCASCNPNTCGGNCCGGANSITCTALTGQNTCPSGSYNCGFWEYYDPGCSTFNKIRRWTDCCGGCDSGNNGRCINGTPTCCRHKTYPQQGGVCSDHIKCRYVFCH